MRLKDKVAVVTGGSQGIGAAICEQFATEGAKVFVLASSSLDKAEKISAKIRAAGGDAVAGVAEVTSPAKLAAVMNRISADAGRLDILVNSAGVFYQTPVGTSEADVSRMIDVNFKGTVFAIAAAVPLMKAGGGGKIINLSSCAAVLGLKTYSVYCATKAAVSMLTRTLALELAPLQINVNAIAPGNTETPINENIRTQAEFTSFLNAIIERTPSGRAYSKPEEMARLAVFLASDDARAMHGTTVLMDEGFSAGI